MTWICRRGFKHPALLQRFEFCRDLPLCFGFLTLRLSLCPNQLKLVLYPSSCPAAFSPAAGLPWLCTCMGLSIRRSGPHPWDDTVGDFAAASPPLWSVCAVCAFPLSLVLGLHKGVSARFCWTDDAVRLALGACRLWC